METNDKAQEVLGILATFFTRMHNASKDGKVDTAELLGGVMAITPAVTKLAGVDLGNS